jgi:hypothetical protein
MGTHCECGICGHFNEKDCIENECKCCSNFHLRSGSIIRLILFESFQLVFYHLMNL